MIEALLVSTGIVAVAEFGDKTQLLALVLAARFGRPWPIIAGILVATVLNHGLAGLLGAWVTSNLGPDVMRWLLGASFLAMAAWVLVPDRLAENAGPIASRGGVFMVTLVAFFLAEMGDKTQVATVVLAAHYPQTLTVVAGTTLGMLLANLPAVLVGRQIAARVSLRWLRALAAALFAALGAVVLLT